MKKILPLIFLFVFLFSAGVYAQSPMEYLFNRGVITAEEASGNGQMPVTREQFAYLAVSVLDLGENVEQNDYFSDIEKSPYRKEINTLYAKGGIKGSEEGKFEPESFLTRGEMAAITGRLLNISSKGKTDFYDDALIPVWAKYYVKELEKQGILNGYEDNTFRPFDSLTFEDACYLAQKLLVFKEKGTVPDNIKEGKDTVIISSAKELTETNFQEDKQYVLTGDLDFSGITDFTPINEFKGVLDGRGYGIINFKAVSADNEVCLFRLNSGTIKNLYIKNFYAEGRVSGGLVLENRGNIENVCAYGFAMGNSAFGIALKNSGNISGCAFSGRLMGETVSGISVENPGNIEDCFADGDFYGRAAAIAFKNSGTILKSCYMGTSEEVYKISSDNSGSIKDCYVTSGGRQIRTNTGSVKIYSLSPEKTGNKDAYSNLSDKLWNISEKGPHLKIVKNFSVPENTREFSGGDGSIKNPFKIASPLQISNIKYYPSASFILINDGDMSLITKENTFSPFEYFDGMFFGGGREIRGIRSGENGSYIFRTNGGVIKDLVLGQEYFSDKTASGLCFENSGVITGCVNKGDIEAEEGAAFSVINSGIITGCINRGRIKGNKIAGICLSNTGVIKDVLNYGELCGMGEEFLIFGISGGENVKTSLNLGDMYSDSQKGNCFPISDGSYSYSYYYDRPVWKKQGGLDFRNVTKKESYKGFSENVWDFSGPVPCIKGKKDLWALRPPLFTQGNGTEKSPYVIKSADDLYNVRMSPQSCYILGNDIIFPEQLCLVNNYGQGFIPIEDFTGTLDGNGFYIYGFKILYGGRENSGLIGINNGTVKNLTVNMATVEAKSYSGGIAAVNNGEISEVNVINSRIGSAICSGGVSGVNNGHISSAFVNSDVFSKICAGGIAGANRGSISKSTKKGGVIASDEKGEVYSGGISGENFAKVYGCENNGRVMSYSENGKSYCGGIAGGNAGEVINSFNTGFLTAKGKNNSYAGGIAGVSKDGKVSGCYNTGYSVLGGENSFAGDICASGTGRISQCVYDETRNPPVGSGRFKFYAVSPLDEYSLSVLGEAYSPSYGLPFELKENPHREDLYTDNIRDFAGGNGTEENPYLIFTPSQLDNVRYYPGSCFALISDVDMTFYVKNNGFESIGGDNFGFFGTFLGNGYKIKGLSSEKGMFSVNHGDIYGIVFEDVKITGEMGGAVAFKNTGTISDCVVINPVFNSEDHDFSMYGGIVKTNYSTGMIISCYAKGNVYINGQGCQYGGICVENYGIAAGCGSSTDIFVKASNYAVAGGIACGNYGVISDALNQGTVTAECDTQSVAGGIAGTNGNTLLNCISSSQRISALKTGGISANNISGGVYNCYYLAGSGIDDSRAKGLLPHEFSEISNFENFDFETVWCMGENGGPCLSEFMY